MKDLKGKELNSIKDLRLDIQRFAEGDNPPADDQTPKGDQNEVIKFGNVSIPKDGLTEEQLTSISKANEAFVSKEKKITELGTEKSTLTTKITELESKVNPVNPPATPAKPVTNPEIAALRKEFQSIKLDVADGNIADYKRAEHASMVSLQGKKFADDVFAKAEAEFNTKHLDVGSRTAKVFDTYVKFHAGNEMSKPRDGVYNVNDPASMLKMMNDPAYKTMLEKYSQSREDVTPYMQGSKSTMNQPRIDRPGLTDEQKKLPKSDRLKLMKEQMAKDERSAKDNAFLGN